MTRLISALLLVLSLASSIQAGTLTFDTYYHNDHLGSPVAATDERSDLLWRAHFRPYGERKENPADAAFGNVGYTGHMQDADSSLVYMQARYYDPLIGRFLAIDPAGIDAGKPISFNRYIYSNSNPYLYVDPDGRNATLAMGIVVIGAIILVGPAIINSNGWSTSLPAHQGGGEAYGGSSIDPTISGPWSTSRPIGDFNWPTWMSSEGAKSPKTVEEISNPPQAPVIPSDWVSRPGRNGGEIYFPPGTDPAKGEHIRVMPPGSSPVPGYENGYWRWQNSGKQPMNPATGKPGIGQGDTHIPLPADSLPPVRR